MKKTFPNWYIKYALFLKKLYGSKKRNKKAFYTAFGGMPLINLFTVLFVTFDFHQYLAKVPVHPKVLITFIFLPISFYIVRKSKKYRVDIGKVRRIKGQLRFVSKYHVLIYIISSFILFFKA